MERLPEEITKGKAVTYKLVKLKNPISYYDMASRSTAKYTHAVTICDIPVIYAYFKNNECVLDEAQAVGDNIKNQKWWEGGKGWEASDFPSVDYGFGVGVKFINAIDATLDEGGFPNHFWEKAFGEFKYQFVGIVDEDEVEKGRDGFTIIDGGIEPLDFCSTFALSFIYYTQFIQKDRYPTFPSVESTYLHGESVNRTLIGFREYDLVASVISSISSLEGGGLQKWKLREKRAEIWERVTPSQLIAWVDFVNTLAHEEWKYRGQMFGIVNRAQFDIGGISLNDYISSLKPASKKRFLFADMKERNHPLFLLEGSLDFDLWAGYLLSPANSRQVFHRTMVDGPNWGGIITPTESANLLFKKDVEGI